VARKRRKASQTPYWRFAQARAQLTEKTPQMMTYSLNWVHHIFLFSCEPIAMKVGKIYKSISAEEMVLLNLWIGNE
jgi:hypothetical protein